MVQLPDTHRVEETHEFFVDMVQAGRGTEFGANNIQGLGHMWDIYGSLEAAGSITMSLLMGSQAEGLQDKRKIDLSLTLVNFTDPSKSVTKGDRDSLTAEDDTEVIFGQVDDVNKPDSGFLNRDQKLCVRVNFWAQGVDCTVPPAQSVDGDLLLQLDDCTLTAHAPLFQLASTTFAGALACSSQREAADEPTVAEEVPPPKRHKSMLKLPLPGTSKQQALLLLHCLYAGDPRTWTRYLDLQQLVELARVAHRFSCTTVLQLVDSRLVKLCRYSDPVLKDREQPWMADAPANYALASQLGLAAWEKHIGHYIGEHPSWVDLDKMEPGAAAMLRGAGTAIHKAAAAALARAQRALGRAPESTST